RGIAAKLVAGTLALLVLTIVAAFAADHVLGSVVTSGASIDGVRVPAGTSLVSPAVIQTREEAAVVHLLGGRVLSVEPATVAHLELKNGVCEVTVDEGAVRYLDQNGKSA